MNKPSLLVVKIGGNVIDDENKLHSFLSDFVSLPQQKILVHGGGKLATELSGKLGIETKMVNGRRITDAETIKAVTMTYAGWINKNIVAKLQSKDCTALGLSGADVNLLPAKKRPVEDVDYGFVGDLIPEWVNSGFLRLLVEQTIVPVVAPITSNHEGTLLNVNADTVAQVIAEAMSGHFDTNLIYCFEKNGLLKNVDDHSSIIPEVNFEIAETLKTKKLITDGMIPKIDNAFAAIKKGVHTVIIGNAFQIKELADNKKGYGTRIQL